MIQLNQAFLFDLPNIKRLGQTGLPAAMQFQRIQTCPQGFACQQAARPTALPPGCHKAIKPAANRTANRQDFDDMIGAFKASGGTARADDLALLLKEKEKGNFATLAKQLVLGDVFSFEFQSHFWIPMFQFNLADMTVKQDVARIVSELAASLDSWSLAQWLTQPNAWLTNRSPVDMIVRQFSEVLAAARVERFVAHG